VFAEKEESCMEVINERSG